MFSKISDACFAFVAVVCAGAAAGLVLLFACDIYRAAVSGSHECGISGTPPIYTAPNYSITPASGIRLRAA